MSLVDRYAEDIQELTSAARKAAAGPTQSARRAAFHSVLIRCRTASQKYADPRTADDMLIKECFLAFMQERRQRNYTYAG